nr:unnamed protein product [Callosobruchus chinensis]
MLRHQEGSQRDAVAQEQARAQYTQVGGWFFG